MYNGEEKCVKVYHRKYGMCDTNIFITEGEIIEVIDHIAALVGKTIDSSSPFLDARLEDGSRLNATIPPASPYGPTLTIRKFLKNPLTIISLIKNRTINPRVAAFLWMCVDGLDYKPANLIVSGGTGSGKTTFLNALAVFIREGTRLVTIEDTTELQLMHEHIVRLETIPPGRDGTMEISMDTLLKNSLRMRPDRIIVGEVRGSEAVTMFTAMNTGHDGCMGTLHANTAKETATRLMSPPMNVAPIMLTALDLLVVMERKTVDGKTVRKITEISEIAGLEKDRPRMNNLYKWDPATNLLKSTGVPSRLRERISRAVGIDLKKFDEIQARRERLLKHLVTKDQSDMLAVSGTIQKHYFRSGK
jgi:flagellar protein FlaI